MYCIYRITNKLNGHTYIGQHKYSDRSNPMKCYIGSGIALHKAYKKYGFDSFSVEILQKNIQTKKLIDGLEKYFIAKYKPEYNIAEGGQGGDLGPEVRVRISKAMKGKKQPWDHRNMLGKRHSEETRKKIAETCNGRKHSDETKRKIATAKKGNTVRLGKRHSEETRRKMSEAMKGQNKGMHWYNNGIVQCRAYECPAGYVKGRIR